MRYIGEHRTSPLACLAFNLVLIAVGVLQKVIIAQAL